MLRTFNQVSKARYQPAIAKVYGSVRGVPFEQVFKTLKAAENAADKYNGVVVRIH